MPEELITEHDIVRLHRMIEFDELTAIFNWDINHWKQMMKNMTVPQYKRFIALYLDSDIKGLEDFLDQFGIKHL